MAGTRLIIGLGNPGPDYVGTRHNVGFDVIDRIVERTGMSSDHESMLHRAVQRIKGSGLYDAAECKHRGRALVVAKPTTFMNRSGAAVSKLMGRYRVGLEDVLIVVDDIYLDIGQMRVRASGGSGGHNGLDDIITTLDSSDFPRIRIGVGSSFRRGRQADYVLETFADDERPVIDEIVETAANAALTFVTDGIVTAMNRFNKRQEGRPE